MAQPAPEAPTRDREIPLGVPLELRAYVPDRYR